jgi:hypothetical protein
MYYENKNVFDLCKDKKKIEGTIKEGCILDDYVILWSKNKGQDKELYNEYNMIKSLEAIGLPVVDIKGIFPVKIKKRNSVAIIEEILVGELFKPHDKPIEFNSNIKDKIKYIYYILDKNKILIEDLQWIYNDTDLKIIDPYKIYLLNDAFKTYEILGAEQDKRKKPYKKLEASFIEQQQNLYKLFN